MLEIVQVEQVVASNGNFMDGPNLQLVDAGTANTGGGGGGSGGMVQMLLELQDRWFRNSNNKI